MHSCYYVMACGGELAKHQCSDSTGVTWSEHTTCVFVWTCFFMIKKKNEVWTFLSQVNIFSDVLQVSGVSWLTCTCNGWRICVCFHLCVCVHYHTSVCVFIQRKAECCTPRGPSPAWSHVSFSVSVQKPWAYWPIYYNAHTVPSAYD